MDQLTQTRADVIQRCREAAPIIFSGIPKVAFSKKSTDRANIYALKSRLTDPKRPNQYAKRPPLLYPNCIEDPAKIFQNPELIQVRSIYPNYAIFYCLYHFSFFILSLMV